MAYIQGKTQYLVHSSFDIVDEGLRIKPWVGREQGQKVLELWEHHEQSGLDRAMGSPKLSEKRGTW